MPWDKMSEHITKEEFKQAVREVLAEKFEITFGINCLSEDDRGETRKDMFFLRSMRKTAQAGGEKIFLFIIGIGGAALIAFIFPSLWKDIK